MAICRATKHSLLTMQALVTCCRRQAVKITAPNYSFCRSHRHFLRICTANTCCKHALMMQFAPAVGGGRGRGGGQIDNPSRKISIQAGLGLP